MGAAFPLAFPFPFGEEEPAPEIITPLQIIDNHDGKWIYVVGTNGNVKVIK